MIAERFKFTTPTLLLCMWLFGNRRGSTQIWGCVGGYAAYTPPNLEIITVNPNDPCMFSGKIKGVEREGKIC